MDSLTLEEIAGEHLNIYEKYFTEVNPTNANIIKALDAANFLRKSCLNQLTLKTIWDLSDPNCLGYLDKKSFFISLKLISMVQNGKDINKNDLKVPLPPPVIGENAISSFDWKISPDKMQTYLTIFNSLMPVDGKLSGSKVKPYMMNSKLPVDILTQVWDLSDIDKDGFLDTKEFTISCHLIAKVTQGLVLPPTLPAELYNLNVFTKQTNSASQSPLLNDANKIGHWVVSAEDKAKYDTMFTMLDNNNVGYVTGLDVKDTLLRSGLPQNVLAHIWNLCDIKGNGKLNSEQFALTNYFIQQKQNGLELPMQLSPDMVPPTLRPKPTESISNESLNGSITQSTASSTGNKEFDILTDEINQLQLEKVKYEQEVLSEEASLRLKQSEVKNIQNEVETLSQMLKQLENQKNDASRRLDDLNGQLNDLECNLHELKTKLITENEKVDNLNLQFMEQKKKIDEQELDLNSKRTEYETLKSDEVRLEAKLSSAKSEAELVSKAAAETQLEISQVKANYDELEDYERRSMEIVNDFDTAIATGDIVKIASLLPRSVDPPSFLNQEPQVFDELNDSKAEFSVDPFAGEDPFKDDPFSSGKGNDAFGASDNFANFDAFGLNNKTADSKSDPFGFSPFTDPLSNQFSQGDAFRSESPTPALPPKKSKAPPPRPAPPKSSNKTPLRAAPPPPQKGSSAFNSNFDPFNDNRDPFGSDSFSSQNFANFADFDKS